MKSRVCTTSGICVYTDNNKKLNDLEKEIKIDIEKEKENIQEVNKKESVCANVDPMYDIDNDLDPGVSVIHAGSASVLVSETVEAVKDIDEKEKYTLEKENKKLVLWDCIILSFSVYQYKRAPARTICGTNHGIGP